MPVRPAMSRSVACPTLKRAVAWAAYVELDLTPSKSLTTNNSVPRRSPGSSATTGAKDLHRRARTNRRVPYNFRP
eukprot:scaffold7655_cov417-Prasinococcus_capsulatus_cf.AAC.1